MIKDVLLSQRGELNNKLKEHFNPRKIKLTNLENDLIKVVTGPRRCGKSFFAINELKQNVGNFGYVNFDDDRLSGIKDYDEIISNLNLIYDKPKYLFFDEIQDLDKWELFVNRLQRQGYNLIISGSNSKLLSSELSTHLTGRHIEIRLLPFSFKEFTELNISDSNFADLKAMLGIYLESGGYPEIHTKQIVMTEYLRSLFDSIILKDIVKRFNIRLSDSILKLSHYLISNFANEFSLRNTTKIIDSLSVNTVKKYLAFLEESYLFFHLSKFSFKVKEQLRSEKKIYCVDNGFIKAKGFSFSPDRGRLMENLIAIELRRRSFNEGSEIYFWKNVLREEVDFVIKKGLKVESLIQSCLSIDNPKTIKRELRALAKASIEMKCKNLMILSENDDMEIPFEYNSQKFTIIVKPVWKWLLNK
jgi:hypothetical protein